MNIGLALLVVGGWTFETAFGNVNASVTDMESNCFPQEQNTDYFGNDIGHVDTNNIEDCCGLCSANANCAVSVWFNGVCYLKDRVGAKVNKDGAFAYRVNTPTQGNLAAQITYQLSILRQAHGLNGVEYDHDMAAQMQEWADDCAKHPYGGHGGPYGVQNLAQDPLCGDNCMIHEGPSWWWYTEIENWDFDMNDCRPNTASGCGHFQNSIGTWVTHVGCGWSRCYNPGIGRNDPLVWCNYRGNGNDYAIPRPQKSMDEIRAELTAAFKP